MDAIVVVDAKKYAVVVVAIAAVVVVVARTFAKIAVTASFRAKANLIILHFRKLHFRHRGRRRK